jgi:hypothetical protein
MNQAGRLRFRLEGSANLSTSPRHTAPIRVEASNASAMNTTIPAHCVGEMWTAAGLTMADCPIGSDRTHGEAG